MARHARNLVGGIVLGLSVLTSSTFAASTLSKAQQDAIGAEIAELRSSEERSMASDWSDAKKVAEFICSPLAMSELKKWNSNADRVFLGTESPDTLNLKSNTVLTGSGQVRAGNDWKTFTFTCNIDSNTGKAQSFTSSLSK